MPGKNMLVLIVGSSDIKKYSPSLVRESVVIEPLVGQHTAKEDESERRKGLERIPIMRQMGLAEKFSPEAHFSDMLTSKADRAEKYRKSNDIP